MICGFQVEEQGTLIEAETQAVSTDADLSQSRP